MFTMFKILVLHVCILTSALNVRNSRGLRCLESLRTQACKMASYNYQPTTMINDLQQRDRVRTSLLLCHNTMNDVAILSEMLDSSEEKAGNKVDY